MNDDVWRAPGRATPDEGSSADGAAWRPPAATGSPAGAAAPHNPYAAHGDAPAAGYPHPGPGGPAGYRQPEPGGPAGYRQPGPGGPPGSAFATSDRHRQRVLGAAGYTTPAYRNDPVAVASLVLGIVGILVPGVFLLAILTGHLAQRRLRRSYDGGRGLAVAGLVMGYVTFALWASVLLMAVISSGPGGF